MELQQQVVSLELAKKLKELGVKQESLFHYERDTYQMKYPDGLRDIRPEIEMVGEDINTREGDYFYPDAKSIAAYTVAELGEVLPARITYQRPEHPVYRLAMEKQDTRWNVVFVCADCGGRNLEPMLANTEADARAQMLVYLLENKLITL